MAKSFTNFVLEQSNQGKVVKDKLDAKKAGLLSFPAGWLDEEEKKKPPAPGAPPAAEETSMPPEKPVKEQAPTGVMKITTDTIKTVQKAQENSANGKINKMSYTKAMEQGISPEEFDAQVQKAKDDGYAVYVDPAERVDYELTKAISNAISPIKDNPAISSFWQKFVNFSQGNREARIEGLAKMVSMLPLVGDWTGEQISKLGEPQTQQLAEKGVVEPGFAMEAGKFTGDIGLQVATLGTLAPGFSALSKSKLLDKYPLVQKAVNNWATKFAVTSAGSTAIATAELEGKLPSQKDLLIGAVIDAALFGIGASLQKIKPVIYRMGVNPEGPTWQKIVEKAKMAIEDGYTGTKPQIFKKASGVIEEASKQMDDVLKGVDKTWNSEEMVDASLKRAEELWGTGGQTQSDAILKRTENWIKANKGEMTAAEIWEAKKQISKELSNYFKAGKFEDPTVAAQKQALMGIWEGLNNALNSISPEVANLNLKMNIAFSVKNPVAKDLMKSTKFNFYNIIGSIPGSTYATTHTAGVMNIVEKTIKGMVPSQTLKTGVL